MKSTEELAEEHEGVLVGLNILEAICSRLEKGEKVALAPLEGLADFIREFVDRCHHGKEEDVLFPELEKAGLRGPVSVMLQEHNAGRAYVKGLVSGIAAYKAGGAAAVFIENAIGYTALMRSHIEKENTVLYPMADKLLPPGTDAAMCEKFERIEKEKIGKGRHEEFHAMLEKLEKEYLDQK